MRSLWVLALLAVLGGCQRYRTVAFTPVRHVVALDLKDPGEAREFMRDSFDLMFVPGVVNVMAAYGIESSDAAAVACDVGVLIDLETEEACLKLPEEPRYRALLSKWRERSNSVWLVSMGLRCEIEPAEERGTGAE